MYFLLITASGGLVRLCMKINLKEGEIKQINQMVLYTSSEQSMKLKQKTILIVKKIYCAKLACQIYCCEGLLQNLRSCHKEKI